MADATWRTSGRILLPAGAPTPVVMGIVNVTPDSFSDGGRLSGAEAALEHAHRLAGEGALLLDLGGESSRPGSEPVPLDQELRRVVPAVEAIVEAIDLPLSVDTTKAEVARRALAAGASIINDITAMAGDPEMPRVVAEAGAGVVLMHMQGVPRTMQQDPRYDDVIAEVYEFLARRVEWAVAQGIPRERIAVDPGIGFGKTMGHNLAILRDLGHFATLGCAVLIGTSRKGFLGTITGRGVGERATASAVSSLAACVGGARVVRVHDVAAAVDAIKVWGAIWGWHGEETP
ncbi:MAG: dihydropteroate synthase [Isosphaeraceae bacterium]